MYVWFLQINLRSNQEKFRVVFALAILCPLELFDRHNISYHISDQEDFQRHF